eukprot:gb/GEZN01009274.1/.p1 GENE.gb/GEZN01009274.1/~~gb/GEZN01009274.1/.p1  ORF type:complete len:101 (-),score=4.23 gb/GEZN01009274.1/:56-358(-)
MFDGSHVIVLLFVPPSPSAPIVSSSPSLPLIDPLGMPTAPPAHVPRILILKSDSHIFVGLILTRWVTAFFFPYLYCRYVLRYCVYCYLPLLYCDGLAQRS